MTRSHSSIVGFVCQGKMIGRRVTSNGITRLKCWLWGFFPTRSPNTYAPCGIFTQITKRNPYDGMVSTVCLFRGQSTTSTGFVVSFRSFRLANPPLFGEISDMGCRPIMTTPPFLKRSINRISISHVRLCMVVETVTCQCLFLDGITFRFTNFRSGMMTILLNAVRWEKTVLECLEMGSLEGLTVKGGGRRGGSLRDTEYKFWLHLRAFQLIYFNRRWDGWFGGRYNIMKLDGKNPKDHRMGEEKCLKCDWYVNGGKNHQRWIQIRNEDGGMENSKGDHRVTVIDVLWRSVENMLSIEK